MFLKKISSPVLAFALVLSLGLGACSGYEPAFKGAKDDLATDRKISYYSHVASDRLIRQLRGSIADGTPILVGTVANINKLETSNPLGRAITEHISTRFVQRGFTVSEMKLRQSVNIQNTMKGEDASGEFLMSRDVRAVSGEHKAVAIVSGTYAVADTEVLVTARVVDVASGHVLASTDYTIPRNDDVNMLLGNDGNTGFFGGSIDY
jgi:TolB-like protein